MKSPLIVCTSRTERSVVQANASTAHEDIVLVVSPNPRDSADTAPVVFKSSLNLRKDQRLPGIHELGEQT